LPPIQSKTRTTPLPPPPDLVFDSLSPFPTLITPNVFPNDLILYRELFLSNPLFYPPPTPIDGPPIFSPRITRILLTHNHFHLITVLDKQETEPFSFPRYPSFFHTVISLPTSEIA